MVAESRGRAEEARVAHNHQVVGSNPTPATKKKERKVNRLKELLLILQERKSIRRIRRRLIECYEAKGKLLRMQDLIGGRLR